MLKINEKMNILKPEAEVYIMPVTNLNIRTDKDIKEQADKIFSSLGMNTTTAVNLFLRAVIREQGIPFPLKLDVPNKATAAAIEEGRRIAYDEKAKGYSDLEELKKELDG